MIPSERGFYPMCGPRQRAPRCGAPGMLWLSQASAYAAGNDVRPSLMEQWVISRTSGDRAALAELSFTGHVSAHRVPTVREVPANGAATRSRQVFFDSA